MKDTTFWPTAEQLSRLAKSYKPNAAKDGLEETTIGQLTYPLDNRARGPMPAGGLFSTAADCANFCRMALGGGIFNGRRVLSEDAVKEMTRRQTPEGLKENYGLGWSTGGSFGHGGAFSTNMTVDPKQQLIFVYQVQHAGYPGQDGGKIFPTFVSTALELFGK
jgi:CubicO group peptidase (beta-lactamase class C family)